MLGPASDVASGGTVARMAGFPAHAEPPVVHGDGVVLCALEPRDVPAMLENDRDPETAARFGWDPDEAAIWRCRRHVEQAAVMWRTGEQLVFAVRESDGGPLAGIVDAQMRDGHKVELSWTTVPAARGRGVASRAVRTMVGFCGTLGIEQVWAKVDHHNAASLAVARAAGFREAGRDERYVFLRAQAGGQPSGLTPVFGSDPRNRGQSEA